MTREKMDFSELKRLRDKLSQLIDLLENNKDNETSYVHNLGYIKGFLHGESFIIPPQVDDRDRELYAYFLGVFWTLDALCRRDW